MGDALMPTGKLEPRAARSGTPVERSGRWPACEAPIPRSAASRTITKRPWY